MNYIDDVLNLFSDGLFHSVQDISILDLNNILDIFSLINIELSFSLDREAKNLLCKSSKKFNLLDIKRLKLSINTPFYYFPIVESTNSELLSYDFQDITFCFSEFQTQGRGKYLRKWESIFAKNIIFSAYIKNKLLYKHPSLSLVVGVLIAKFLSSKGFDIKLKWPNDIFLNNSKVGGILVENHLQGSADISVIGIGINIDNFSNNINQSWLNLEGLNREDFLIFISNKFLEILNSKKRIDILFYDILEEWWDIYDLFKDKIIKIKYKGNILEGKVLGIDFSSGELKLNICNEIKLFSIGEISINK